MKKITLLLVMIVCFALESKAQEQGLIRAGAGLSLGTKSAIDKDNFDTKAGVGISLIGEYFATDIISIVPSYTFYFKTDFGSDVKASFSSFDIDGRYYFATGDLQFYGLAGLSFTRYKTTGTSIFFGSVSDTGVNLGGGLVLPIADNLSFNGQLKFQIFEESQLVLGAGVLYSF